MVRTKEGIYGIQPTGRLGALGPAREHALYRAEDWATQEPLRCGVSEAVQHLGTAPGGEPGASAAAAATTGVEVAELAIDVDTEFFARNGGDIAATVYDVENLLNAVELIYERDVGVTYEITTIVIRTAEPDPYTATDALTLLCQFRTEWNAVPQTYIPRDTTHLFTGKQLVGNTVGIAWVGVVCNASGFSSDCGGMDNLAYGLSESLFTSTLTSRVALTAHEIGHNWNATHCTGDDCHIMCASLGGCGGIDGAGLTFGPAATSQIVSFKSTRGCLHGLTDPHPVPFFDDFPTTTLDPEKWPYSIGPAITSDAIDEPTPPLAMNLDASGPAAFQDDEIRTNRILLGSTVNPVVSYSIQHLGVPTGGALVIEYFSDGLLWKVLERVESDGVDRTEFARHEHMLPEDARHDAFRLRFRTEVDGPGEDWHVDDVLIRDGCLVDADCDDGIYCNGRESCVAAECTPGAGPCRDAGGCDERLAQCFDPDCTTPGIEGAGGRYLAVTPPTDMGAVGLVIVPLCNTASPAYVGPPAGRHRIAQTVDDSASAAFLTPADWGETVHVTGWNVIPETQYAARTDCGSAGSPILSASVIGTTHRYGDTVGAFDGNVWTAPDGRIEFTDISAAVDRFRSLPTAPSFYRYDLLDCIPNGIVDFDDIAAVADGFRGLLYNESSNCPSPCTPAPK
jgi:hypothetical protein